MLFNSYEFIFVFLPSVLILYFLSFRLPQAKAPVFSLVLASLFFYGWWNPVYLILIAVSIIINFLIGELLSNHFNGTRFAKPTLVVGISANLSALAYYKYAGFLAENINLVAGLNLDFGEIILPLAISFFTFQQIAFLIDAYRGQTKELNFINYCLFVSFFPQLIAGPIVHHKEMMPQFSKFRNASPRAINFSVGLTIFSLGLFKKVVLADGIAVYGTPVFSAAQSGEAIEFLLAWQGSLAYTFQLYFDFSGYSDMAVGVARLFGIRLPVNFNSPYQAKNISDFWRRWHITLSRFLRDYVYVELGGNRKGSVRRYLNLLATMLIGGLWHGAGWTFVIWGGLHGIYLTVFHLWRKLRTGALAFIPSFGWLGEFSGRMMTFIAVVVGWVFFRAESVDASLLILKGMIGLNGVELPAAVKYRLPQGVVDALQNIGVSFYMGGGREFIEAWIYIVILFFIAFFLPNTLRLTRLYRPVVSYSCFDASFFTWRLTKLWAAFTAIIFVIAVLSLTRVSEFLYFQF